MTIFFRKLVVVVNFLETVFEKHQELKNYVYSTHWSKKNTFSKVGGGVKVHTHPFNPAATNTFVCNQWCIG